MAAPSYAKAKPASGAIGVQPGPHFLGGSSNPNLPKTPYPKPAAPQGSTSPLPGMPATPTFSDLAKGGAPSPAPSAASGGLPKELAQFSPGAGVPSFGQIASGGGATPPEPGPKQQVRVQQPTPTPQAMGTPVAPPSFADIARGTQQMQAPTKYMETPPLAPEGGMPGSVTSALEDGGVPPLPDEVYVGPKDPDAPSNDFSDTDDATLQWMLDNPANDAQTAAVEEEMRKRNAEKQLAEWLKEAEGKEDPYETIDVSQTPEALTGEATSPYESELAQGYRDAQTNIAEREAAVNASIDKALFQAKQEAMRRNAAMGRSSSGLGEASLQGLDAEFAQMRADQISQIHKEAFDQEMKRLEGFGIMADQGADRTLQAEQLYEQAVENRLGLAKEVSDDEFNKVNDLAAEFDSQVQAFLNMVTDDGKVDAADEERVALAKAQFAALLASGASPADIQAVMQYILGTMMSGIAGPED